LLIPKMPRHNAATPAVPAQCAALTRPVPDRMPVVIVIIVLLLSAVLVGAGYPVAAILQSLAGAGLIGTEIVRRLADKRDLLD
jgi:hypothetical protein